MLDNQLDKFINGVIDRLWVIVDVRPSVSYKDMLGKDHPKYIDYELIGGDLVPEIETEQRGKGRTTSRNGKII